jgi:hypothetical protein
MAGRAARDAMAGFLEPAELFDIEVDQLSWASRS